MPIASLPSNYGIGTMGRAAYDFIDFLRNAKQKYWQILPVGPLTDGNSPYSNLSIYAGNDQLIDLDILCQEGLLEPEEFHSLDWGSDSKKIDYDTVSLNRQKVLKIAAVRGIAKEQQEFIHFKTDKAYWLDDYALYIALKQANNMKPWTQWPEDIRFRDTEALIKAREELQEDIEICKYIQFIFFKQWKELKRYADEKNIQIIGDIPIYTAMDSADVWAGAKWFQLDEKNVPIQVAGVPPDDFTADGQLWGNPLYRWDMMEADGFSWWVERIKGALTLYDVIRIDHFRGLESYWAVPYGEKTAKNGTWIKGPGMKLINALREACPDTEFIAEDLGYLTDDVRKFLKESHFPGMNVLQFSFDARDKSGASPDDFIENSICYTGTHDNTTLKGWKSEAKPADVRKMKRYFHIHFWDNFNWKAIDGGMATKSKLFVAQMQDYLELGSEARINIPGVPRGNWTWRMSGDVDLDELAIKIGEATVKNKRSE